jgi:hypothetical protein
MTYRFKKRFQVGNLCYQFYEEACTEKVRGPCQNWNWTRTIMLERPPPSKFTDRMQDLVAVGEKMHREIGWDAFWKVLESFVTEANYSVPFH